MAIDRSLHETWPELPAASLLDVEFDRDQASPGVHLHTWWDTVLSACPWYRQAEVMENGETLGRIQYFVRRSPLGFAWGRNPDWSIPGSLSIHPRLTPEHRIEVLEKLIEQLSPRISFYLVFKESAGWPRETTDAFLRNGFEYSRAPTYQWGPDDGDVLAFMKSKARSQLKLAQKQLEIVEIGADAFSNYYGRNLALENERSARPLALAKALLHAASARGAVRITAARRLSGPADHDAAIACTWDDNGYYYWMSSHTPGNFRRNGGKPHKDAVKVLMLDAMRHARSLGLVFDTDGTGSPGSEHLFRDILKLKRADIRHIFRRANRLVDCYERYRPLLLRIAGKMGLANRV